MSSSLSILFFLLCFNGAFWIAYGQINTGPINGGSNSAVAATPNDQSSLGGRIIRLPNNVVQMAMQFLSRFFNWLVEYSRPLMRGAVSLVMDGLQYLASSDNRQMVRMRRSTDNDYQEEAQQNGGSVVSKLSRAFMMPFKMFFGTVRRVPVDSLYRSTTVMLQPLGNFARHPAVRTVTNATMVVANEAANQAWNFTKVNILPKMDQMITSMQESKTLPEGLQKYLNELQALYHVMHMMGLA